MAEKDPIILVADDEPATLKYLAMNLEARGYGVVTASDGLEAMKLFRRRVIDLALLDVTMPEANGFDVCKQIRAVSSIPIIMLTGRATESDVIQAFDAGADDYMTKPFGVPELMARVRAAVRRSTGKSGPGLEPLRFGDTIIDLSSRRVWHSGEEVSLTNTELSLLSLLAKNAGKALTHRFILESVWGDAYSSEKEYVRAYVYRLRSKLSRGGVRITNVPEVGYMLEVSDSGETINEPQMSAL